MIHLCEASIEDQQLARAEFGPEHERSFSEAESLMRETIEMLVVRQFGNREAGGIVLLRSFRDYLDGYTDSKGKSHKGCYELVEILRNKRDLIEAFIESLNPGTDNVTDEWLRFVEQAKREELETIIREEGLRPEATVDYINQCFREGEIKETGTEITKVLPPMPLFTTTRDSAEKKGHVIERLKAFFERFFDISLQQM